jgi:hypothetical protein
MSSLADLTENTPIRLTEAKENNRIGKSRALEFGNELQIYSIFVEDLAYPGHIFMEVGTAI